MNEIVKYLSNFVPIDPDKSVLFVNDSKYLLRLRGFSVRFSSSTNICLSFLFT